MLLPDHRILAGIESGRIGVDPFDPRLVQPASLDVRLGHEFRRMTVGGILDPAQGVTGQWVAAHREDDEVYVIEPGDFVLAHTLETVALPADLVGRLEGKSSLGRIGLSIHTTAGYIDPGFTGQITLELSVDGPNPITLEPRMPIGQLSFLRMTGDAARPYGSAGLGSHYQGQTGATPGEALRRTAVA